MVKCFGQLKFQRSKYIKTNQRTKIYFLLYRSTLKNLFLLSTAQHVIVGSIDLNLSQLQITYYSKQNGAQAFSSSIPWSLGFDESRK